jgi:hypothetical protein
MVQIILIGLAAGLASALMVASLASGSLLALPLFNLAPLPILVVSLGWSHVAGLIAVGVASILLAVIFGHLLFLTFLAGIALPAWWLAYLALLARPTPDGVEWYPIGRITLWIALIASFIVMLMVFAVAPEFESLRAALRRAVILFRDADEDVTAGLPAWLMQALIDYPDRVLLPASAMLTMLMQVFTLWLAARIVRISDRLRRPWPDIAAMRFPPLTLAALVAAALLTLLPDAIGAAASAATASLLTAYALLGLAIIHTLTRSLKIRGLILGTLYGAIAIFGWPLLVMPLIGLADSVLDLRGRAARGPPTAPP